MDIGWAAYILLAVVVGVLALWLLGQLSMVFNGIDYGARWLARRRHRDDRDDSAAQ